MKKSVVILVLKLVVVIATAILGVLGVNAISSCSSTRDVEIRSSGVGVFNYVDTIHTNRITTIKYPKN